jgi:hypothetical protein
MPNIIICTDRIIMRSLAAAERECDDDCWWSELQYKSNSLCRLTFSSRQSLCVLNVLSKPMASTRPVAYGSRPPTHSSLGYYDPKADASVWPPFVNRWPVRPAATVTVQPQPQSVALGALSVTPITVLLGHRSCRCTASTGGSRFNFQVHFIVSGVDAVL